MNEDLPPDFPTGVPAIRFTKDQIDEIQKAVDLVANTLTENEIPLHIGIAAMMFMANMNLKDDDKQEHMRHMVTAIAILTGNVLIDVDAEELVH